MADALYRKYRPQTFKDVVGQDHITSVLAGSIEKGSVGHAYLFTGSRGLGKTSIARIFAREIGCSETDTYEIDAASHTGVDHMRELADNVHTQPFESPYKVYIIDEVHMLSKSAFNAFLKTLEEPPSYVVFILATTEAEKLPDTVVSRCQNFAFKKPSRKVLAEVVATVAKKEDTTLEAPAAELIALLADGSFRDALSILQKILSSTDAKTITSTDVEKVTGAPRKTLVSQYVSGIATQDPNISIAALREAEEKGIDMHVFLTLILEYVRSILLLRYSKEIRPELEEQYGSEEVEKMDSFAKEKTLHSQTLVALLQAHREMKLAPIPALPLELAVIDLIGQDSTQ